MRIQNKKERMTPGKVGLEVRDGERVKVIIEKRQREVMGSDAVPGFY